MKLNREQFNQLSPEEKKAYTEALLGSVRKAKIQRQPVVTYEWPQRPAQWIAGLFGLPVERYPKDLLHPLTIYTFIFILLAVQFLNMGPTRHDALVENWGFIPSQFYSHYFLTLFTSFFIHGGWAHLIGNAYYFYVYGDDVESDMSFQSFLVLLFGGHLAGLAAHGFLTARPDLPLVGASAGISAIMGYYMMRFPNRQISYMIFFFYIWINIPAYWALLWKFGWEAALAGTQMGQSSGVALWAHVGGACFGGAFALFTRSKRDPLLN